MDPIEGKILYFKRLLKKIIEELNYLTSDNFNENIKHVQATIEEVRLLRNQLKSEGDKNIFKKYDAELLFLTKQIKNSFDNVSRKIKTEADLVSKELRDLQNSKKLTSYNR